MTQSLVQLANLPQGDVLQALWRDVFREVVKRKMIPWSNYIPVIPHRKQFLFLQLMILDAFYGGAAGGGKSAALLMAALQYIDIPKYAALLLRDTYANLTKPEGLMDMAEQWLAGTDARWKDKHAAWYFPNGSTLTFGYLAGPRDHLNYKSAAFQFIGTDESTDLRWKQIRYMFSRLRRLQDFSVPLRFRCASNPGGISHKQFKIGYVDPKTREQRVYIPARLEDNPSLDRVEYEKSLAELDSTTRRQLRLGDWEVTDAGKIVKRSDFQIVDIGPAIAKRVRYWDLAATEKTTSMREPSWTVGVRMARTPEGLIFVEGVADVQEESATVEALVRQTADIDTREVPVRMEQEPGASGKANINNYLRNVLPMYDFKGDRVTGDKETRFRPFANQVEAGNVFLVNGSWIPRYLEAMEALPDDGWDYADATSGAYNHLTGIVRGKGRIRVVRGDRGRTSHVKAMPAEDLPYPDMVPIYHKGKLQGYERMSPEFLARRRDLVPVYEGDRLIRCDTSIGKEKLT